MGTLVTQRKKIKKAITDIKTASDASTTVTALRAEVTKLAQLVLRLSRKIIKLGSDENN